MVKKALIVVDIQNDFVSGSLAIDGSEEIIQPINELISKGGFELIVYTKDSHPVDHCSFLDMYQDKSIGSLVKYKCSVNNEIVFQEVWPKHCVKDSFGEKIHSSLIIAKNSIIHNKGEHKEIDSYSSFIDNIGYHSDLKSKLDKLDITEVYICGLAFDYCVGYTALDAKKLGFNTYVLLDLTKYISEKTKKDMINKMITHNVAIINSNKL